MTESPSSARSRCGAARSRGVPDAGQPSIAYPATDRCPDRYHQPDGRGAPTLCQVCPPSSPSPKTVIVAHNARLTSGSCAEPAWRTSIRPRNGRSSTPWPWRDKSCCATRCPTAGSRPCATLPARPPLPTTAPSRMPAPPLTCSTGCWKRRQPGRAHDRGPRGVHPTGIPTTPGQAAWSKTCRIGRVSICSSPTTITSGHEPQAAGREAGRHVLYVGKSKNSVPGSAPTSPHRRLGPGWTRWCASLPRSEPSCATPLACRGGRASPDCRPRAAYNRRSKFPERSNGSRSPMRLSRGCPLVRSVRDDGRPTSGPSTAVRRPKSRGLLDETLVVWASEMGRTPFDNNLTTDKPGRDHNQYGLVVWMAGGNVKGGATFGETDDFSIRAAGEEIPCSGRTRDFAPLARTGSKPSDFPTRWSL